MLHNITKAVFGSRKIISGKYSIFWKCHFPEKKTFSCVWLSQNSFYGKLILVFGSFKHFYRKCIKSSKRNKTLVRRAVRSTIAIAPLVDQRALSSDDRAARSTIAQRDLIDRDRRSRRSSAR